LLLSDFLCFQLALTGVFKMNAASALRARMATSFVARRGFSTTRAQLGSPYHYAEGPRSNIPFNPLTKYFFWRYWAFMSTYLRLNVRDAANESC
jgi:cytochrome c oxidase subunit 7c